VSDPNNQRELTATFGRVYKQRKYTRIDTLNNQNNLEIGNLDLSIGNSGPPAVEAGLSSAAAGGSGRALFERSGTDFGCLFFWVLFFGQAKKSTSPAGASPGLKQ
jgi:hypothetical protein